jgi:hypothetical protein
VVKTVAPARLVNDDRFKILSTYYSAGKYSTKRPEQWPSAIQLVQELPVHNFTGQQSLPVITTAAGPGALLEGKNKANASGSLP